MTIISTIRNFLASKVMSRVLNDWSDQSILLKKREKFELIRKKEGRQHQVFYFHELSDPYSHITAQLIRKLNKNYNIDLIPLLVGEPPKATVHEPSLYRKYCLSDALRIAPFYQVEFPSSTLPEDNLILLGQRVLSSLDKDNFINSVAEISNFVWSGNQEALEALVDDKTLSKQGMLSVISSNEEKRDKVEAYMGSTFSYEGELYWGADRLDYLEERLIDLGLKNNSNEILGLDCGIYSKLITSKYNPDQFLDEHYNQDVRNFNPKILDIATLLCSISPTMTTFKPLILPNFS